MHKVVTLFWIVFTKTGFYLWFFKKLQGILTQNNKIVAKAVKVKFEFLSYHENAAQSKKSKLRLLTLISEWQMFLWFA